MKSKEGPIAIGALIAFAFWTFVVLPIYDGPRRSETSYAQQHTEQKSDSNNNEIQSLLVPNDPVGLYTLVLAIFTGLLTVVSFFQGWMLLRADRTARLSAEAANNSASYIRNADRPFITPLNPRLRNYTKARLGHTDAVHVDFGLENLGKGIGFVLSYGIAHEICFRGAQGSQELAIRDQFGRLPIGPGSRWQSEAGFDVFQISGEDLAAILECRKTLYVYGYIRYVDLFGITRRTGFSYELFDSADSEDHEPERLAISVGNPALWYDQEETSQHTA